jgi:hypothetical protein
VGSIEDGIPDDSKETVEVAGATTILKPIHSPIAQRVSILHATGSNQGLSNIIRRNLGNIPSLRSEYCTRETYNCSRLPGSKIGHH